MNAWAPLSFYVWLDRSDEDDVARGLAAYYEGWWEVTS